MGGRGRGPDGEKPTLVVDLMNLLQVVLTLLMTLLLLLFSPLQPLESSFPFYSQKSRFH